MKHPIKKFMADTSVKFSIIYSGKTVGPIGNPLRAKAALCEATLIDWIVMTGIINFVFFVVLI